MALESATHINDFVATNPLGADDADTADDHIRLIKEVLKRDIPFTEAITSSAAELNILDGCTASAAELNILDGCTATVSELNLLASRSLASTDDVIDNFPSGTIMLFQQTAAPTGWTKGTTYNDSALRIVSGTASTGGTDSFSTTFSASKATDSHTLTTAEIPAHTHTYWSAWNGDDTAGTGNDISFMGDGAAGDRLRTYATQFSTSASGSGGGHTHTIAIDLEYVDVILASKD